jgi:hypothetical protein
VFSKKNPELFLELKTAIQHCEEKWTILYIKAPVAQWIER